MRRPFLARLVILSAIGHLIASGCGGGGVKEEKVTGSVTMSAKAQDGARVSFIPANPQPGVVPKAATTGADGKFEIMLPAGKYSVVLSRMVDKSGKVPGESENPTEDFTQLEASGALRQTFPATYTATGTTPIAVEIPAGGKDLEPFVVGK